MGGGVIPSEALAFDTPKKEISASEITITSGSAHMTREATYSPNGVSLKLSRIIVGGGEV